jgi:putative tricarboxylic transport membrane protein
MIKSGQDFWAGVLFIAAGLFIFWAGRDLAVGTASRMAAGYFPRLLAGALCIVGGVLAIGSTVVRGEATPRFAVRPFCPLVAVVVFGLLLKPLGLVIATTALIFISVLGADKFRLRDALILSVLLTAFNWLVFIWGLGLLLPVWPRF